MSSSRKATLYSCCRTAYRTAFNKTNLPPL